MCCKMNPWIRFKKKKYRKSLYFEQADPSQPWESLCEQPPRSFLPQPSQIASYRCTILFSLLQNMGQFRQFGGSALRKGDLGSKQSKGRCWGLGFPQGQFPAQVPGGFHRRFWLRSSSGVLKSDFSPLGKQKLVILIFPRTAEIVLHLPEPILNSGSSPGFGLCSVLPSLPGLSPARAKAASRLPVVLPPPVCF